MLSEPEPPSHCPCRALCPTATVSCLQSTDEEWLCPCRLANGTRERCCSTKVHVYTYLFWRTSVSVVLSVMSGWDKGFSRRLDENKAEGHKENVTKEWLPTHTRQTCFIAIASLSKGPCPFLIFCHSCMYLYILRKYFEASYLLWYLNLTFFLQQYAMWCQLCGRAKTQSLDRYFHFPKHHIMFPL